MSPCAAYSIEIIRSFISLKAPTGAGAWNGDARLSVNDGNAVVIAYNEVKLYLGAALRELSLEEDTIEHFFE